MRFWVDTDFGFDDLWALLLLKHLNVPIDGVSLVAGNVPLAQVRKNACAAVAAFDFDWPVYAGADKPLQRDAETAERILGPLGMQSRGIYLPYANSDRESCIGPMPAVSAIAQWLHDKGPHQVIALGPLTNLAMLQQHSPAAMQNIEQLTWLGGSRGRGNHTEFAEYNAVADPEALALVVAAGCPFRMIDLELCRRVGFGESQIPAMTGRNSRLLTDLLGGYLDIALQRGRSVMSIYDPLAALAVARGDLFEFAPASVVVTTDRSAEYGRTTVNYRGVQRSHVEIATELDVQRATGVCLTALTTA